jgi:hypothetical protein
MPRFEARPDNRSKPDKAGERRFSTSGSFSEVAAKVRDAFFRRERSSDANDPERAPHDHVQRRMQSGSV